jgi:hypothetical protein
MTTEPATQVLEHPDQAQSGLQRGWRNSWSSHIARVAAPIVLWVPHFGAALNVRSHLVVLFGEIAQHCLQFFLPRELG